MSRPADWDRQPFARLLCIYAIRKGCGGGTNIEKSTPLAEGFFIPTEPHAFFSGRAARLLLLLGADVSRGFVVGRILQSGHGAGTF